MSYCLNPNCQQPENLDQQGKPNYQISVCLNCGANLILAGRYRAIKSIGAGGMGRTFLGIDESKTSEKTCAIKQFFPENLSTGNRGKAANLFQAEVKRLEELGDHPQIPKLLDSFSQDDQQYIIQEYIDGRNLAEELTLTGPFSETKIRLLLQSILPVLEFVHKHQVIHRDIKPENIIRSRNSDSNQSLILVDFGAAKYTKNTMFNKTGTSIGSAAYTAPEQVRGKAVFASDIYSLGVTCIHLLTDIAPFDLFDSGENKWIWRDYLKKPINKNLGKILDKMLENATNLRYQSASEVREDLGKIYQAPTQQKKRKNHTVAKVVGGVVLLSTVIALLNKPQQTVPPPVNLVQPTPVKTIVNPPSNLPDYGGLYYRDQDGKIQNFTLEHTEVSAKIAGNVSRVEVIQTFTNPLQNPLEAIYQFPLPDEAAVDDMEIRIGERVIKGLIKKREEAKQIYQQAKRDGKTAGLLEQERDNVFTQSLANIKPGEKIEVVIRYTDSLKFAGGNYEFVFPMVVGPRYQANGGKKAGTNAINSPTLPPDVRSRSEIGVTVEIDAGLPIKNIESTSHQIQTQEVKTASGSITQVQLSPGDKIPNKDLVLRYQISGNTTESTVLTQGDNRGGHFGIYLIPALTYNPKEIVPKDVIFLMDTSGSQSGQPLEQCKALMRRFLTGLNPSDTFTIIDFANSAQALSNEPLANTPENRQKALNYVNKLEANGGTELMNGINKVLSFPPAQSGRLRSIVLLTDGLIDNEDQIIAGIQTNLKEGNRLYSFGVGSSVNRFLLDRLAEAGRGISYFVNYNENIDQVTEKFFTQINNPVLTNIEVNWEGMGKKPEIYPQKAPDLFAEQPLVLFGRKQDKLSGNLKISGIAVGGKRYEKTFNLKFDENTGNQAIAQLWGRAKIKDLTTEMARGETAAGVDAVTDIALGYNLMSKYTAFVAVSDEVRVDPSAPSKTAKVAINTPAGMQSANAPVSNSNATTNTAVVPEPTTIIGSLLGGGILIALKRRKQKRDQ